MIGQIDAGNTPESQVNQAFKVSVSLNGTDFYDLSIGELAIIFGEQRLLRDTKAILDFVRFITFKTKIEHVQITCNTK